LASESTTASPVEAPPVRVSWIWFAYLAVWGYILYGVGNATPHLRADLHLSDFEAGLHGSFLAVGVLIAGAGADWVEDRFGSRWLTDLAVADVVAAIVLLALAPTEAASLAAALMLGLGGSVLGIAVNVHLGSPGGREARRVIGLANAFSMLAAGGAPLAIGLAASTLNAWRLALLLPVVALVGLTIARPREPEPRAPVRPPRARLPRAFWFIWLVLVLGVSIEFSFVFWGSTIVARQTGMSSADATLLASLFVAGMFVGRAAIGRGVGGGRPHGVVLAAGLGVVAAGAGLVWISTAPILCGLGLFLGGLGTSPQFPVALAVALQTAPKAQYQASARVTLASGIAVLLAPSVLGLAADHVGVVGAWPIIFGLAAAELLILALSQLSATPRS
jgi:MFS family permease